ncbi:MAG: serine/threonine-protein kinase [Candidatus Eisenbacteria bacterium]
MDGPDERVIRDLFLRIASLRPEERSEAIDAAGLTVDARKMLEELLDADSRPGSPLDLDEPHEMPEAIGPYRPLRELGRGGMGVVYLARAEDDRLVAIKTLRQDRISPAMRARFAREVESLRRLEHPGVCRLLDASLGAEPYFVMEYIDGPRLSDYVRATRLDLHAKLELIAAIADAVEYAHGQGVVHRDLKPSNVLLAPLEAEPATATALRYRPKVVDFGVARFIDGTAPGTTGITTRGTIVGTIRYMSPEQIDGDPSQIGARADVYSLAVIGYEILVGAMPYEVWDESLTRTAIAILRQPPRPPREIDASLPPALERVLMQALEKEPATRYATMAAFREDLLRVAEGRAPRAQRRRRRRAVSRSSSLVIATLILALVALSMPVARYTTKAWARREINSVCYEIEQADRIRFLPDLTDEQTSDLVEQYQGVYRHLIRIPTQACTPALESYILWRLGELHLFLAESTRSPQEVKKARDSFTDSFRLREAWDLHGVDSTRVIYGSLIKPEQGFAYQQIGKTSRMLAAYDTPVSNLRDALQYNRDVVRQRQAELAHPSSKIVPVIDYPVALAYGYAELGGTLIELGSAVDSVHHVDEAIDCLRLAEKFNPQSGDPEARSAALFARGKAYLIRGDLSNQIGDLDSARICYRSSLGPNMPTARSIYRVHASLARVDRVAARLASSRGERVSLLRRGLAELEEGRRHIEGDDLTLDLRGSFMTEAMLREDLAIATRDPAQLTIADSLLAAAEVDLAKDRLPIHFAELTRERGRLHRIRWQLNGAKSEREEAARLIRASLDLLPADQLPRHGRLAKEELAWLAGE